MRLANNKIRASICALSHQGDAILKLGTYLQGAALASQLVDHMLLRANGRRNNKIAAREQLPRDP